MSAPTKTVDDGATERWARAAQLAAGVDDDQLRQRRRRVWWLIIGLMAFGFIGGLVLGLVLPREATAGASDDELTPRFWVGVAVGAIGIIGGVAGFIWAKTTGHYITRWRAVWAPLNRAERKSVSRQIRGKEPVDHEHLSIVLAGAVQARRSTLGLAPIFGGVVLIFGGTLILGAASALTTWLYLLSIALFAVAAVGLAIQYRQVGRFLERNGDSPRQA